MPNAATLTPPDTGEEPTPDVDVEPEAPRYSIHDFVREETPTLYDDAVEALIDAQEKAPEGIVKSITVLVPSEKKGRNKHLREFRASAAAHDRTARVRGESDQEDGMTAIEFTLTPKITRKPAAAREDTPESE